MKALLALALAIALAACRDERAEKLQVQVDEMEQEIARLRAELAARDAAGPPDAAPAPDAAVDAVEHEP